MVEPLGLTPLDEYGIAEPESVVEVTYRERIVAEADADAEGSDTAEAEAAEPASEVAFAENTFTLTFGDLLDDGNVVVKSSDQQYYVAVRESVLTAFRDINHADLLIPTDTESETESESGG